MIQFARLLRAIALAGAFATVSGFGSPPRPAPTGPPPQTASPAPIDLSPEIALFYRKREFRPLWVHPESLGSHARRLVRLLRQDGFIDTALADALAAAEGGERRALARADLLLSRAFVRYAAERHRPPAHSTMRYFDPALAPAERGARELLEEAAAAPSLGSHLERVRRVNPAHDGLRRGLAAYRARWSRLPQVEVPAGADEARRAPLLRRRLGLGAGATDPMLAARLREFQEAHGLPTSGNADAATLAALNAGAAHYERLILANIERARAIPARPGRYVLVDTASARLWMIEDGRIAGAMRVIVGKPGMETPSMASLIGHAVLNPYWNLPPDLIRRRARTVLRRGPGAIAAERLQILSDWSPQARTLSARQVDWHAVAAGRRYVNLRQRPGPLNMMGAVKFMMPNDLGIYLHDTPLRHHFARDDRRISSGCVRVEDAQRLARWLFGGAAPRPSGAAEQRIDLPEPVPVYITYLTALPSHGSVAFVPDRYGRDRSMLARLEATAPVRRP